MWENQQFEVPTRSDTNQTVQPKKLELSDLERRDIVLYVKRKQKATNLAAFVFAYADCWFSGAAAQILDAKS